MTKPTEEHRSDFELSNKDLIERCLASMKVPVTPTKPVNPNAAAYCKIRDKKDDAYIASLMSADNDSDMLAELELVERMYADD